MHIHILETLKRLDERLEFYRRSVSWYIEAAGNLRMFLGDYPTTRSFESRQEKFVVKAMEYELRIEELRRIRLQCQEELLELLSRLTPRNGEYLRLEYVEKKARGEIMEVLQKSASEVKKLRRNALTEWKNFIRPLIGY